ARTGHPAFAAASPFPPVGVDNVVLIQRVMPVDDDLVADVESLENLNLARADGFARLNFANLGPALLDAEDHRLALLFDHRHAWNRRGARLRALHPGEP